MKWVSSGSGTSRSISFSSDRSMKSISALNSWVRILISLEFYSKVKMINRTLISNT